MGAMGFPLARLFAGILTWTRAADVSQMTTDRRQTPTRGSWKREKRFMILRIYEFMTFAFEGVILLTQNNIYPRCD